MLDVRGKARLTARSAGRSARGSDRAPVGSGGGRRGDFGYDGRVSATPGAIWQVWWVRCA
jgi:hypothetical protein